MKIFSSKHSNIASRFYYVCTAQDENFVYVHNYLPIAIETFNITYEFVDLEEIIKKVPDRQLVSMTRKGNTAVNSIDDDFLYFEFVRGRF